MAGSEELGRWKNRGDGHLSTRHLQTNHWRCIMFFMPTKQGDVEPETNDQQTPVLEGAKTSNTPFLVTIIAMFTVGIAGVVAISFVRKDVDVLLITAAMFAFITPTTASILAYQKAQETHLSVNSRLDGFIANASIASRAKGFAEGRIEADKRTDALKKRRWK